MDASSIRNAAGILIPYQKHRDGLICGTGNQLDTIREENALADRENWLLWLSSAAAVETSSESP